MKNKLQYFSIYLLIIMTTSLIYSEYINIIFVLNIITSTVIIFSYKVFLNKKDLILLWFITFILLSLYLYTNGSYTLISMVNTLTTFYFTIIYFRFNKDGFIDKYINIITIIAFISLIGFISDRTDAFNFIIEKLPQFIKSNPGLGTPHGGFVYVFRNINQADRNKGFCYEPGKYQYFLNLALYLILFCKLNIKHINLKFIIILVTLITTMSTTGIVMGIIILMGYILMGQNNNISKKTILICIGFVSIVLTLYFHEQVYEVIVKKLQFNSETKTFEYGSGKTRINDIKLDIEIFRYNIFGNGWKTYEEYWRIKQIGNYLYTTGSSSNSFTSMFAVYGIVFSLFINIKYMISFLTKSKKIVIMCLLIFMYFYQNLSQSFSLTPLMIIFMISQNEQLFGKGV